MDEIQPESSERQQLESNAALAGMQPGEAGAAPGEMSQALQPVEDEATM